MYNEQRKKDSQKMKEEQWDALLRVVNLFRRYFTGEASRHEQNSIETWEPIENETELLNDKTLEKNCDTKSVWNAVAHELKFDRQPLRLSKERFFIGVFQRRIAAVAAILILMGGGIVYYTHSNFTRHHTDMVAEAKTFFKTTNAQTELLVLPDGSHIQLNRGTKLSYATHAFNDKIREVWLEGEAFFYVAKNPNKPFIIHTGAMRTTVRGTSFDIKAYPQLAENVVSVRTGKVEIIAHNKVLGMLTKNKKLAYNRLTDKAETSDAAWEDAAGWREGKLVLCNANVKELQFRIKQYFNADLTIEGSLLKGVMFNSSFNKETGLKDILERICTLYNVHYELSGNKVRIYA